MLRFPTGLKAASRTQCLVMCDSFPRIPLKLVAHADETTYGTLPEVETPAPHHPARRVPRSTRTVRDQ